MRDQPLVPGTVITALVSLAQESSSPGYTIKFDAIGSSKGNAWYDVIDDDCDRFSFQVSSVTNTFGWVAAQAKAKRTADSFRQCVDFFQKDFNTLGLSYLIRNHEPNRETRENRYFKVEMRIFKTVSQLNNVGNDVVQQLLEENKLLREQLTNQTSSTNEELVTTAGSPRSSYIKKDLQRRVIKRALRKNDQAVAEAQQALVGLGMSPDLAFRRVVEFINSGKLK